MKNLGPCPSCGGQMFGSLMPLKIRGHYVGEYDATVCSVCKRYYFTDRDYQLALKNAIAKGIIGRLSRPGLAIVQYVGASGKASLVFQSRPRIEAKAKAGNASGTPNSANYSLALVPVEATG